MRRARPLLGRSLRFASILAFALALGASLATMSGVIATSRAQAQEPDPARVQRARELFTSGVERLQGRDFQGAADIFREALSNHDAPAIRYNLALALFELHRYQEAQVNVDAALASPEIRPQIRDGATALRGQIAEQSGGLTVIASGATTGVQLYVNDQALERPQWGQTIRMAPGSYSITARRGGAVVAEQQVTVAAGQSSETELMIDAASGGGDELGGGGDENGGGGDENGGGGFTLGEMWMPGWYIAGGGAVVAIVGAILAGIAFADHGALLDECGGTTMCGTSVPNVEGRASGIQAMASAGDALLYGGIGIAAAGAVLALFGSAMGLTGGEDSDQGADLSLMGGPTGGGMQLTLQW